MTFFESLIAWDKELLLNINSHHNAWMDLFMIHITDTLIWAPLYVMFLFFLIKNKKSGSILLILILALLITFTDQIASGVFKPLIHRFRPTHDPELSNLIHVVQGYKGGKYGFFSSHAANIFAFASFSMLLLRNTYYSIAIISWALLISYSRIYLGVHFPLDILTGIVFGFASGIGFYKIHHLFDRSKPHSRSTKNRNRAKIKSAFPDADVALIILTIVIILITCLLGFRTKL